MVDSLQDGRRPSPPSARARHSTHQGVESISLPFKRAGLCLALVKRMWRKSPCANSRSTLQKTWQLCCPWKPAQVKSPTTLRPSHCKTEQPRGEAVWKDGDAQPAPSSPSHPSWGARHVSEETTLDTPVLPHHMEQKTCPAEPSPGCSIIRNNKLLFGVREEET